MFKKILKGMFVLAVLAMINNPAQAFYTDMDENHWAYQSPRKEENEYHAYIFCKSQLPHLMRSRHNMRQFHSHSMQ